jgi:D-beta-D-heptose 7-phosphate kinase/D-beta-D-heptose 1-phosphate adenosyltransferase
MAASSPTLERRRLLELLEGMRGRRIAIVGDLMLDRYLVGDSERISPEAPVPVVAVRDRRDAPGGAANVAANVVALGGEVMLLGVVGEDADGAALRRTLDAHRIMQRGLIPVASRRTTVKTRVLARGQQVVRIDEEDTSPLDAGVVEQLERLTAEAIQEADALVLEDYNKGVLAPTLIRLAIDAATARGIPIVVDPKYHHFFDYAGATLFKPNRRELEDALGSGADLTDPATLHGAVARLGVEYLLLTLGSEGMLLVALAEAIQPIPSHAHEVFDISGAGDTVTAWVAAAMAAGAPALEAALLANLAAGIEVGKAGVATVSPAEVVAGLPPA